MELSVLLISVFSPVSSNIYILFIIKIIISPEEYLDTEIFGKSEEVSSPSKVIFLVDDVKAELHISIPKLWITKMFPFVRVKAVGYLKDKADTVWIIYKCKKKKITIW